MPLCFRLMSLYTTRAGKEPEPDHRRVIVLSFTGPVTPPDTRQAPIFDDVQNTPIALCQLKGMMCEVALCFQALFQAFISALAFKFLQKLLQRADCPWNAGETH